MHAIADNFSLFFSLPFPYSKTEMCFYIYSYVLSFSLGAGPVPALLLPEIFSSRIRAKAVALSLGMHWVRKIICEFFLLLSYDFLFISEENI